MQFKKKYSNKKKLVSYVFQVMKVFPEITKIDWENALEKSHFFNVNNVLFAMYSNRFFYMTSVCAFVFGCLIF